MSATLRPGDRLVWDQASRTCLRLRGEQLLPLSILRRDAHRLHPAGDHLPGFDRALSQTWLVHDTAAPPANLLAEHDHVLFRPSPAWRRCHTKAGSVATLTGGTYTLAFDWVEEGACPEADAAIEDYGDEVILRWSCPCHEPGSTQMRVCEAG